MNGEERDSGIDILGHAPWGTHFCQFYETPEDLTSILVPYFKAGLENNDFCIWVTAEPLEKEHSLAAMRRAMPDFNLCLAREQIEIIPYDQWYLRDGIFNLQIVLERWIDKLNHALKQGYDGLRVTGNTSWLEKNDWKRLTEYEEELNKVIGEHRMMAVCTYSLNRRSAAEVIDVVNNHQFALIRRQGQWQMMESAEHKQAKEAWRKAEENFRRSMDESPLGIRIVTPEGKTVYTNRAILDIYGYSSVEELEAIPRRERYTPESYAEHQVRKEKRKRGDYVPSNYEISIVRKDGEIRHLEVLRKEVPWNGKTRFQVLYQDITARKHAEETLRESEKKYRYLFDNSSVGIVLTEDKQVVLCNSKETEIFGYKTPSDLIGRPASDFVHKDDLPRLADIYKDLRSGKTIDTPIVFRGIRPDGRELFIEAVITLVALEGQDLGLSFHIDITARKHAEEALRESENRYRTLFESAAEGILIADFETRKIKYTNPAICMMLGYSQEELTKMSVSDIHPKTSLERVLAEFSAQAMGEKTLTSLPCLKKDGTVFYADINVTKAIFNNRECNVGFFTDITGRKRAEGDRQRVDKLESVGTLAGGIAHDFNNLLTGILGNIEMAKKYSEDGEMSRASAMLSEAERASLRAKDLTQQLLTFAKGGAPIKKLASITELAKKTVTFTLSGSNVKCQFDLPDDLWALECDEGQIGQVISNIVINAEQAMPQGGILKLSARNTVIGTGGTLPLPKGNYVEIIIEDHGIGIPREHLERIFDPYFTTKHRGSGLGLATSYSIIKNHGGHIRVESELGVGTTFYVYLPASNKPVRKIRKKQALRSSLIAQGRILVMDDEEIIRKMLSNMLGVFGCKATLAKDGAEAIEKYTEAKKSGQPFDAVILDLTIPGGMGGREAIKKLIEIDPDVKAIVSSGYATDPVMADYKKHGFSAVVTKPYSAGELERTLRSILETKK